MAENPHIGSIFSPTRKLTRRRAAPGPYNRPKANYFDRSIGTMPIISLMRISTELSSFRCHRALRQWSALVVLAFGLLLSPAHAAEPEKSPAATSESSPADSVMCHGIRVEDEIQLVNTRQICGGGRSELMLNGLKVENYTVCDEAGHRRWQSSDLNSFLAFDPTVPTIIFVHGNQITPSDAKDQGLLVYRRIIQHGGNAPRIRFVIFSWPSSKVAGLIADAREKAARTEPAGWHLAWLLDQMPAETPTSLIGFSFGGRIINGGLHILAGGSLGGSLLLSERAHPSREPMNVVLMAAATHSYWLAEGQHHGLAMTQVNRMLLINNCADRAMVYYDFLTPGIGGPQALGLCGPTRINRDYAEKIRNRDVSRYVGPEHQLINYMCAPGDASLMWKYTGPQAATETKIGG